jgi:hypothetical protein
MLRRRSHRPEAVVGGAEAMTRMRPWRMLRATETHHHTIEVEVVALDRMPLEEILERKERMLGRVERMADERRSISLYESAG